jgi:molybdopterin-guanine dinucleotide biosynthesis protein MobB
MAGSVEKAAIPIVSIVGLSGSGKTTLIERLVPELAGRGYRVATVKHDAYGFEIDLEGKDSWRHKKAGAVMTVVSSPDRLALIRDIDHDAPPEEIRNEYIRDADIILTEGYKSGNTPKVEVYRSSLANGPLFLKSADLVALVSDRAYEAAAPCLGLDDVVKLADMIERRFLGRAQ